MSNNMQQYPPYRLSAVSAAREDARRAISHRADDRVANSRQTRRQTDIEADDICRSIGSRYNPLTSECESIEGSKKINPHFIPRKIEEKIVYRDPPKTASSAVYVPLTWGDYFDSIVQDDKVINNMLIFGLLVIVGVVLAIIFVSLRQSEEEVKEKFQNLKIRRQNLAKWIRKNI